MKSVLLIGSNFGARRQHIDHALEKIKTKGEILRSSSVYESDDFLKRGMKYMNIVLEFETSLTEGSLHEELKRMEFEAGRTEMSKERGEVPLDIDIVIWKNEVRRPQDFNSSYFKKGYKKLYSSGA